jgi:hypothetical protein
MKTTNRCQAGGNAATDEEASMDIQGYLEQRCALHNIRRGDLPALLGYRNSAKALRRYDRFIANTAKEKSFASKLRACPVFAGDGLEQAIKVSQRLYVVHGRTQQIVEDLKLRRAFKPHVWFMYKTPLPDPVLLLMHGEARLRSLTLPPELEEAEYPDQSLPDVINLLRQFILLRPHHHVLNGPYGKAVTAIYRDTFDHGFIIDINTLEVIGERTRPIIPTTMFLTSRNKISVRIRGLEG